MKEFRKTRTSRVVGSIEFERLPENLVELVEILSVNPDYDGHSRKAYANKESALEGDGPFFEFVAKGNRQRLVMDAGTQEIYVTLDHHKTYHSVG